MKCPNCGFEQQDGLTECEKCQVIFEKWYQKKELEVLSGYAKQHSSTSRNVESKMSTKKKILIGRCSFLVFITIVLIVLFNIFKNKILLTATKEAILKQIPAYSSPDGYYKAGRIIIRNWEGRYDDLLLAEAHMQKALKLNPNFAPAYVGLSMVARRKGYISGNNYSKESLEESFQLVNKALEIDPNLCDAYNTLATVLALKGKFSEAHNAIQNAINIDSANSNCYEIRGFIYRLEGNQQKAIQDYEYAIQITSEPIKLFGLYEALGLIYCDTKEYDKSALMYEKALELKPNSPWELHNYAITLRKMKRFDESIEKFNKALSYMDFGAAHSELAKAYCARASDYWHNKNNYYLAARDLEEAIKHDPDIEYAKKNLPRLKKLMK